MLSGNKLKRKNDRKFRRELLFLNLNNFSLILLKFYISLKFALATKATSPVFIISILYDIKLWGSFTFSKRGEHAH